MKNPGGAQLGDVRLVDFMQTAKATSAVVSVIGGPVLAHGTLSANLPPSHERRRARVSLSVPVPSSHCVQAASRKSVIAAEFRFISVIVLAAHLNFLKRTTVDSAFVHKVDRKPRQVLQGN